MDKQLTGLYVFVSFVAFMFVCVLLLAAYNTWGGHEWVPDWLARPVD